jgi:hypothetical protein
MGNRIMNYYRRKNPDDPDRPIPEDKVGDVQVLLPEDKSPFANFGMVDPGETVRAVHNAMYRAPIFKHEPQATDFLVIRTSTGVNGSHWYLRNINNLFAVGQQFPSVEVPGPHSRKVTNAAKSRMKMLAFRKIRRNPNHNLKITEITEHITHTTDVQNRQKLKEFIQYDKNEKVWKMKPGENVPDEATVRAMVKPEDVCLIDAMQVGARHLEDSGYHAGGDDEEHEDGTEKVASKVADKPEGKRGLEYDLAPWRTSKAFLEASADKAMLELYGAGDPSGHGFAFSFIKTSMKGGYGATAATGPSATSAAAMEAEKKANGGHGYNVKKQQAMYNDKIREIWEKQKANLSNPTVIPQNELELEEDDEEETRDDRDDRFEDNASVFSVGNGNRQKMRITRLIQTDYGTETKIDIIENPRVFKEYQRRRALIQSEKTE